MNETNLLDKALIQRLQQAFVQLSSVVVGKKEAIRMSLTCLLARGHLLIEDLPGSGKTTLAKAFAATLGLDYRRIQFTADLLPADVVGFSALHPQTHELRFHPGPVFTQLLLADEINRASPKSQSALLEAMEERQVTLEHETHKLPVPFFVIATQNPREHAGTYALPEAQLDRFLMRLSLGYPEAKQEVAILRGRARNDMISELSPLLSEQDLLTLQKAAGQVIVSEALAQYVQKLLAHTRDHDGFRQGLSTRAGLALIRCGQAYALLSGSSAVLPKHIQAVFAPVAWHRLKTTAQDDIAHARMIDGVLDAVPVPL
ncbi:MoxR family ATPase [Cardiobacteriaceae bacterium TAE3-ERU3]|nr:MoxR family ATPase [Cardiobacteriaceae bacterium TAE3-ERU3]